MFPKGAFSLLVLFSLCSSEMDDRGMVDDTCGRKQRLFENEVSSETWQIIANKHEWNIG